MRCDRISRGDVLWRAWTRVTLAMEERRAWILDADLADPANVLKNTEKQRALCPRVSVVR
jgi:hypothetical protein